MHWILDSKTEKTGKGDTLCHESCAMHLKNDGSFLLSNDDRERKYYRDFDKVYPEWMLPKLMERLPLREYIFANYQKALAKKYKLKKCLDIPPDYHHDLKTIRRDLEKTGNLFQDKYEHYNF